MHIVKGKPVDCFNDGDLVIATDDSFIIEKGKEYRVVEQDGVKYVRANGVYTSTARPIFKLKEGE